MKGQQNFCTTLLSEPLPQDLIVPPAHPFIHAGWQQASHRRAAKAAICFVEPTHLWWLHLVVEQIMELTDGRGVDVAIEALGTQGTFENALRVLRPGKVAITP